jgi:ribosomal protein L33
MKNFTQKFIGILALVFTMSFTVNAQDYGCMDSNYAEFNENSNTDDGSCSCPVSVELNISNASCNLTDGTAHVSGLECSVENIEATTVPTVEITITEEFITSNSYLLNSCISNNNVFPGGPFMILSNGPDNSLIYEKFFDDVCTDNQYFIDNGHPVSETIYNNDQYSFEFYGNSIETCYAWTNSEGVVLSNQESVSNLSAGTYTFTYTNGECSYSDSFEVGSCIYFGCMDSSAVNYDESANTDDGSCVAVVHGCTDANAFNYNAAANTLDDSCVPLVYGCTDASAFNFDSSSNTDDGSCVPVILGCTDGSAFNYNTDANTDDGSCVPVILGCTDGSAFNYNTDANTDDGSCNSFTFHNGWSLFGYTCLESQNVVEAFSVISESIEIVKDEWGLSYLPAWGFSAFENLEFGEGYQIKLIEDVINFQFCEVIVPEDGINQIDVDAAYATGAASVTPEDGITQADIDAAHAMYEGWCASDIDNDGVCDVDEVSGCMDVSYCNYVPAAEFDDNSCAEDLGCGCDNPAPQQGYDCDGNELQIGDTFHGGVIFQINEDGTGLVADLEDLGVLDWFDAMAAANSSTSQDFDDWYLPNLSELVLMNNTIGFESPLGNIGGFGRYYWSSSEYDNNYAWYADFDDGVTGYYYKYHPELFRVRVIRAF